MRTIGTSLTFDLAYGQRKCFTEDLPAGSMTRGTVHVSSGKGEMSLDVFVSDMRGTVFFHKADVNSVKFSFETGGTKVGTPHNTREKNEGILYPYRFCIVNQVNPHAASTQAHTMTRRVTLQIEAVVDEKDRYSVVDLAKQEHADKVYSSFLQVSTAVDGLIEKMDDLRAREKILNAANAETSRTIFQISIVACIVTIGIGVMNFLSLKSFFKRKKLA